MLRNIMQVSNMKRIMFLIPPLWPNTMLPLLENWCSSNEFKAESGRGWDIAFLRNDIINNTVLVCLCAVSKSGIL